MSRVQGIKERNKSLEQTLNWESLKWIEAADDWFYNLPTGYQYTSDELREAVGSPSQDGNNGAVGAKIKSWNHAKQAIGIGYRKSNRTTSHARPVMVWEKQ